MYKFAKGIKKKTKTKTKPTPWFFSKWSPTTRGAVLGGLLGAGTTGLGAYAQNYQPEDIALLSALGGIGGAGLGGLTYPYFNKKSSLNSTIIGSLLGAGAGGLGTYLMASNPTLKKVLINSYLTGIGAGLLGALNDLPLHEPRLTKEQRFRAKNEAGKLLISTLLGGGVGGLSAYEAGWSPKDILTATLAGGGLGAGAYGALHGLHKKSALDINKLNLRRLSPFERGALLGALTGGTLWGIQQAPLSERIANILLGGLGGSVAGGALGEAIG